MADQTPQQDSAKGARKKTRKTPTPAQPPPSTLAPPNAPQPSSTPPPAPKIQPPAPQAQPQPQPPVKSTVEKGKISKEVIRKHAKSMPLGIYNMKDNFMRMAANASFLDALLLIVAFVAMVWGLGFYPWEIALVLLIILFVVVLFQPFIGLIVFTIFIFPIFMYQAPVLAWTFLFVAAGILFYGYMHYRVMAFTYLIVALALSPLGYLFVIPAFLFAILTIGNKRAIITLLISVILIVTFSGITGLQNTGYIVYNGQYAHDVLSSAGPNSITGLDTWTKPSFGLLNLGAGFGQTLATFFSSQVTSQISASVPVIASALLISPAGYVIQLLLLIGVVIIVDWYAATSRAKFRGTTASLFGVIFPFSYVLLSLATGSSLVTPVLPIVSFIIAPATFYMMEYYDIGLVKTLDVRKQDIRMKFGEAFEDLGASNSSERFSDIGNYDSTKKEIRDAIIAPIEERGISRTYNIQPAKGLLFFGPPGTGKTMMMRALANEIHGGFFYVKSSNVISAFPGESEKMVTNVFTVAKKNAPCVLFFDELDTLALSREVTATDDAHKQALSQLLVEMDGFQKVSGVIFVGATNRPDLIDSAILRPGRIDKIIYMPLPDKDGRKKIFQKYLEKLPISDDVDMDDLAAKTERYSGADIKAVTEAVAQIVAQEATSQHKVLEITQEDIMSVIRHSKPSTSLAQIDSYKKFKLDFERSSFQEKVEEPGKQELALNDVIGVDDAKKAIRDAIEIPLTRPDLMKKYAIKPVNGVLFFGPPGTGKTMLMKAVSSEMKGVAMLELSGSELSEAGLERATATIKEVFNRARENAPAVIFIDEIDGIFPKREGASELMIQVTSEILTEIDGIKHEGNIVVIGATNRPDILDPAILRPGRFDKLVFVKPPGPTARSDLFKKYLSDVKVGEDVDYQKLGSETDGFTGADITGVCREAKTNALEQELKTGEDAKITMQMVEDVLKNAKPSATSDVVSQYKSFLNKYGQR